IVARKVLEKDHLGMTAERYARFQKQHARANLRHALYGPLGARKVVEQTVAVNKVKRSEAVQIIVRIEIGVFNANIWVAPFRLLNVLEIAVRNNDVALSPQKARRM